MRKKDLELGKVYADKYGHPVLLVSTRIWVKPHREQHYKMLPSQHTVPERGYGWTSADSGVLVVQGPQAALEEFAVENATLLKGFRRFEPGAIDQENKGDEARAAAVQLRSLLDFDLTLTESDYRRWKGTPAEHDAKVRAEEEKRKEDWRQVREKAKPIEARAQALTARTQRLLGLEGHHWSRARFRTGIVHVGDASLSVPREVEFSLDEWEKLLGLAEKGPGPRRGDTTETWLKEQRDGQVFDSNGWHAIDGMLDRYRLHADEGRGLAE